MSYYTEIIDRIKEQVDENEYPPIYVGRIVNVRYTNCYAYALNIRISDMLKKIYYPGCINMEGNDSYIYSSDDLMKGLKKDLDFLGFSYRANSENLEDGEYRIGIYAFPTFHDLPIGFHFSRQDKDGCWSEKPSWKSRPRKFNYFGIDPPKLDAKICFKDVLILKKINKG